MALKTANKITVKVDGQIYQGRPGGTYDLGGIERSPVEDTHEPGEFTTSQKAGKADFDLPVRAGMSLREIEKIEDATVLIEADTGQQWVGANWYCVKAREISGGVVKVTFAGPPAEEMVGAANG